MSLFPLDIVDLRSSDDENGEQNPMPKSGYGNKNFIIPVTFLDFYRNVKLLRKCKPLSIKVVDCDKYPWYYRDRMVSKSSVKENCLTPEQHSNLIKQEIKEEKTDEHAVILADERVKTETLITSSLSLKDGAQDEIKVNNSVESMLTMNHSHLKLEDEPEIATKSKDLSQVDLRRNSGLVGLTVSRKDLDSSLHKVTKKKTPEKRKEENTADDKVKQGISVTLNNIGTIVTTIAEKKDDNILNDVTKDSHGCNVTCRDLSSNSNVNVDKIHNNPISPTRCSLKITSSKILEKVIKLKKAKSPDASKKKPRQKPKNSVKDYAVPRLNLKRRLSTENKEFYIVNSTNALRSNSLSVKSQETQKDQSAVDNDIQKKKLLKTSIVPFVTVTLRIPQKNTPDTSTNAEKLDQAQTRAPRSYHKKLKLKKMVTDNDPNKVILNEPITATNLNTPNNQDTNASISSFTSGLSEVVVSGVQSLSTINYNRTTREDTETDLSRSTHLNYKPTINIDTAADKSNVNIKKTNENVVQNGDNTIHGTKTKDTYVPPSQSTCYLQVYNAYALNGYANFKELCRKTSRVSQPGQVKSAGKILKEAETITPVQNQMNRAKDNVIVTNNLTNYNVPNRDAPISNGNINYVAMPPKTVLNIQKFNGQIQLGEYLHMNQNQFNTQVNPTYTINNILAKNPKVHSIPGNNTVILRNTPAHAQTGANRTFGFPVQTVNHRPTYVATQPTRNCSPWSYPPPTTNLPYNLPNYNMPNMNARTENQINPRYYRPVTNFHCYPTPSSTVEQERNSNITPVKNYGSNSSVIGSTANGQPIKKINIGGPPSDNTVINDKQKMFDTLNNFTPKISDPRLISQVSRVTPCSPPKKDKIDPKTNVQPSNGYSPPILPIPSFQKAMELVKMKQKVNNVIPTLVEMRDKIKDTGSTHNNHGHRSVRNISRGKTLSTESKKHDRAKKISLEEYKRRASKDGMDVNKIRKHKCKRKEVSKYMAVDNNQDLGYDSDATMKL